MLKLTAVCLALLAVALGQGQPHCCFPEKWEGSYSSITGYKGSEPADAELRGSRIHYDATGRRTAASGYRFYENSRRAVNYTVINNYATGKRLYVEGNSCTIEDLSGHVVSNCIPTDWAHHSGEYIGAGANNLTVDVFSAPLEFPNEFHVRMVGGSMCIPFQMRHVVLHQSYGFAIFSSFNRITPGIADDKVFDTPEQCKAYTGEIPKETIQLLDLFHDIH